MLHCFSYEEHLVLVFDDAKTPAEQVDLALKPHHDLTYVTASGCRSVAGGWHAGEQRILLRLTAGGLKGCVLHGVPQDPKRVAQGAGWIGTGTCGARAVFWSLTFYDA